MWTDEAVSVPNAVLMKGNLEEVGSVQHGNFSSKQSEKDLVNMCVVLQINGIFMKIIRSIYFVTSIQKNCTV